MNIRFSWKHSKKTIPRTPSTCIVFIDDKSYFEGPYDDAIKIYRELLEKSKYE